MLSRLPQAVRSKVSVVVLLGALASGGVAAGFAIAGTSTAGAGNATTPPPCAPNTPTALLPSCENGPKVDALQWPITPSVGQSAISQARAIQIGRAMVTSSDSSASSTDTSIPAAAESMTYEQANQLLGDGANPKVDPATPVWVVTVHAPFSLFMAPSASNATSPNVFTIIIDSANGAPIDACAGCSVVGG
jgi:hypothetical protein